MPEDIYIYMYKIYMSEQMSEHMAEPQLKTMSEHVTRQSICPNKWIQIANVDARTSVRTQKAEPKSDILCHNLSIYMPGLMREHVLEVHAPGSYVTAQNFVPVHRPEEC